MHICVCGYSVFALQCFLLPRIIKTGGMSRSLIVGHAASLKIHKVNVRRNRRPSRDVCLLLSQLGFEASVVTGRRTFWHSSSAPAITAVETVLCELV